MKEQTTTGWSPVSMALVVALAFLMGLVVGWIGHGIMMRSIMGGGMMNGGMMNGDGMMDQDNHSEGIMHSNSSNGSGMTGMMSGDRCRMMMQSMMDQVQSLSGMSGGDMSDMMSSMDGMMNQMDLEAMRQHCRSMHASMREIMHGDRDNAHDRKTDRSFEGIGWIDESDLDWVQSIRGLVEPKDARDRASVTVKVGTGENGLQFRPAVLRVDAGTRLQFEWTGNGGSHNVNVLDHDQASPLQYEQGATYETKLTEPGSYRYVCTPHRVVNMQGLVVVE